MFNIATREPIETSLEIFVVVFTALEAEFRLDTDLPVLSVSFLISKASFTPSLLAKSAPILPNCSVIERSARIEALSLELRFQFEFLFTKSMYFSSSILPPFFSASSNIV
ncbi:hypothetical protein THJ050_06740 [Campylobacter jejuni]|nr:hypothetical protein THJ005_13560 [Campylobacter jejuni]GKY15657.1 hypothetical protein THJ050_06740 [Campylobacter jejuni]